MKTLALPESVFANILLDLNETESDENSNVIVCTAQNSAATNGDWAVISAGSREFYRYVTYVVSSGHSETILLSNTNLYNLNCCSVCSTKPEINGELHIKNTSAKFVPKYAQNANIAVVASCEKLDNRVIDTCLKNYFDVSRYLHAGDVVCIDVEKYAPEVLYLEHDNLQNVYFKIETIDGPDYDVVGVDCGYLINCKFTTVHQVTSTQCFLPAVHVECNRTNVKIENIGEALYNVIPDGLRRVSAEIENMVLPFLHSKPDEIELSPIFLLSGKSGTGKTTLISAIAKQYGLQYCSENCVLIQNSNPAQTETLITNIFANVSIASPCILHFRNIEALCEDESGSKDDRTINYFMKLAKSISSKYPVIILCTSLNEPKISPILQRIFLQIVRIDNLDVESRELLLNWILKKACLRCEYVEGIARLTFNFVFADLIQLVSRAIVVHFQQLKTEAALYVNSPFYFLTEEDFLKAVDEMNATYAGSIGAPEIPNITWDDVGGLGDLKEEILSSLLSPVSSNGLYRSGLLLHGPPGTGKTLLAKAIATECKYNFLSVKGPELLNMYVGQSEKNVREVFARARDSAPCIVFFDELDSLAPKRGQSGGSGSVMDRVVSQLLAEMDGIQKSKGIFILAATNRPDLIDSALLRPGRLDKMLFVGSCNDTESKINVLKALMRKFKLSADINFEKLVEQLPSRSITGADLYGICSGAWLNAARRLIKSSNINDDGINEKVMVTNDDLMLAILQFKLVDLIRP